MTTGSRGPARRRTAGRRHDDFDAVREFAQRGRRHARPTPTPDRLTTAARKKDRGDRLYLDVQRNAYAQTAVAPWTVRALPGRPSPRPVTWEQLDDPELDARRWTVADAVEQAARNPWAGR